MPLPCMTFVKPIFAPNISLIAFTRLDWSVVKSWDKSPIKSSYWVTISTKIGFNTMAVISLFPLVMIAVLI